MDQIQTATAQRPPGGLTDTEIPIGVEEACKVLGVRRQTLYGLTSGRKIPFFKSPGGKKIYFMKSELIAWMTQTRVSSVHELEQKAIDYVNSTPN